MRRLILLAGVALPGFPPPLKLRLGSDGKDSEVLMSFVNSDSLDDHLILLEMLNFHIVNGSNYFLKLAL